MSIIAKALKNIFDLGVAYAERGKAEYLLSVK